MTNSIPIEHVHNAIKEAMLRLEEDWQNEKGEWECPWVGYEHYCLEMAIELLTN